MRAPKTEIRKRWLIYAGLAFVTIGLYLPVVYCDFVQYDDQQYVTDNPRVQSGFTWPGFLWAFGFHAGNWHPLAWLSHMLDCQLYGAWAGGHHLTSLLLHVATTLLLFNVLCRMTQAVWRSAVVAALFAWHPLHVESVAWVAERKDVLCAFFWMLTLWAYVRHVQREPQPVAGLAPASAPAVSRVTCHRSPYYWLAMAFFALALMAKPMAVTLPFVLFLLDYWPLNRMGPADRRRSTIITLVLEKVPYLILAGVGCLLTLKAQQLAIVSTAGLPVFQRLVHVLIAYEHYLLAMFWPHNLAVFYPFEFHPPALAITMAGAVLALVTIAVIKPGARPYLVTGWLWFLGTLVPVIGVVQVGDQDWADRYTYLPSIGIFISVVWITAGIAKARPVVPGVAGVAIVALTAMTAMQLSYWSNTRTLFEHTAKVTDKNALAVTILGSLLAQDGKQKEAMQYYQTALQYTPMFPEAHFFLGNALDEQGRLEEAVAEYRQALWFKPMQGQTHVFLAIALAKLNRYDEAIEHYHEALKIDPDSAAAHNNLARLYHTLGRFDEAITHYNAALEIDPRLSIAHNNLGILLLQKGRIDDGVKQLREAIRLRPNNAESQYNLALALSQQGKWSEAADLFKNTIRKYAGDPKAHYEFAVALGHLKRIREAMSEYAAALLLQPDYANALDGLAWILSTDADAGNRNGDEAYKMAARACELTSQKEPAKLKTLAAAYAETGHFAEAVKTIQSAGKLAAGQTSLVDECARMQAKFEHAECWRE